MVRETFDFPDFNRNEQTRVVTDTWVSIEDPCIGMIIGEEERGQVWTLDNATNETNGITWLRLGETETRRKGETVASQMKNTDYTDEVS